MQQKKIILLASDCESSRWVYNALEEAMLIEAVILEQPISKKELAKNRIRKIGFIPVAGQVLFSVLIVPLLKLTSKKRKACLVSKYRLNSNDFNNSKTYR
jgi:hypothetical protein